MKRYFNFKAIAVLFIFTSLSSCGITKKSQLLESSTSLWIVGILMLIAIVGIVIKVVRNSDYSDEEYEHSNNSSELKILRDEIKSLRKELNDLSRRMRNIELQNTNNSSIPAHEEPKIISRYNNQTPPNTVVLTETLVNKPEQIFEKEPLIDLAVVNGELHEASPSQISDYKANSKNGRLLFEFSSNRTLKAINNRTILIDPFCEKTSDSKSPDEATAIIVCSKGELDSNYKVIKKVLIKYI